MQRIVLIMLISIFWLFLRGFQADRNIQETAHVRLKEGINKAAHDASMQVDDYQWGQGKIVFNHTKAIDVFRNTLAYNTDLRPDLNPIPGTFFADPIEITFEDYVDDSSGVVFPFTYINDREGIYHVLKGPAVVYKVRTKVRQTNPWSYKGYIRKTVVFEYPYP